MNYSLLTFVLIGATSASIYMFWCGPILRKRWSLYPEELMVMFGYFVSLCLEDYFMAKLTIFRLAVYLVTAVISLLCLRAIIKYEKGN
jgi:hypothetical protein